MNRSNEFLLYLLRCWKCNGRGIGRYRRAAGTPICGFCAGTGHEPIPSGELFSCCDCTEMGIEAPCQECEPVAVGWRKR
jgi:hypothetical protein